MRGAAFPLVLPAAAVCLPPVSAEAQPFWFCLAQYSAGSNGGLSAKHHSDLHISWPPAPQCVTNFESGAASCQVEASAEPCALKAPCKRPSHLGRVCCKHEVHACSASMQRKACNACTHCRHTADHKSGRRALFFGGPAAGRTDGKTAGGKRTASGGSTSSQQKAKEKEREDCSGHLH